VIVLGRYQKTEEITFRLSGKSPGGERSFKFVMDTANASKSHGFVPRLWATRKVAVLVEALRDQGADKDKLDRNDPKVKELIDEVIRLSLRYGVLTEYTAFLAKEGTPITGVEQERLFGAAVDNIQLRAITRRSGLDSVNQEYNINRGKNTKVLNRTNEYWSMKMTKTEVNEVTQVGNKAYFRRGQSWEDSQNLEEVDELVVSVGTEAFSTLVDELLKENEQGCLALHGDIRVSINGKNYLIKK